MRQFDSLNSYHDNEGNLLHGRITFCKKGTTVKENIYDKDGNILPNPMYTNQIGQCANQVFLADVDYTVIFDKIINTELSDEEAYVFQYSLTNLYDTFNISVETRSIQVINTIHDLRQTDPDIIEANNGNKIIQLAGYNAYGDKPTVNYVWDESSISDDDGGSVIKVEDINTGRWILVNSFIDGLDVRHFGCFPVDSAQHTYVSQSYAIQAAYNYASRIGVPIYFPATSNSSYSYYQIKNTTIKNAIIAENVRIVCPSDSTANIYLADNDSEVYIYRGSGYYGTVNVYGKVLASSVSKPGVNIYPREKLIIDSEYLEGTYEYKNIAIDIRNEFANSGVIILNNCDIACNSYLDSTNNANLEFVNCTIRGSEFKPNTDIRVFKFTDCISSVDGWNTASDYLEFCVTNKSIFVDLDNKVAAAPASGIGRYFQKGTTIKNGKIDGALYAYDSITLKNVSVNNLRLTRDKSEYLDIHMEDAIVEYYGDYYFNDFYMNNSTFMNHATSFLRIMNGLTCINSDIDAKAAVKCVDGITITNSVVRNVIDIAQNGGVIEDVSIIGNIFANPGKITLDNGSATIVSVTDFNFMNNIASGDRREILEIANEGSEGYFNATNTFIYENNKNTEKLIEGDYILLRVPIRNSPISGPYLSYEETEVAGVKYYAYYLHNLKLSDVVFNIGNKLNAGIRAYFMYANVYDKTGNLISASGFLSANDHSYIYEAGSLMSRELHPEDLAYRSSAAALFEFADVFVHITRVGDIRNA